MFRRIHDYATVNAGIDHECVCRGIIDSDEAAVKSQMDSKAWGKGRIFLWSLGIGGVYAMAWAADKTVGHVYARFITGDPICKQSLHVGCIGSLLPTERYSAPSKLSSFHGRMKLFSLSRSTIFSFTIVLFNSTFLPKSSFALQNNMSVNKGSIRASL